MPDCIMVYKESKRCAADSERRATDFEDTVRITVNITIDIDSLITQDKKSGNENSEK